MDASLNPPPALVVVGGRLGGTRRSLTAPLTLFGQNPGCDVRLNVEGVLPLHAALVRGPDGFHVRDLAEQGGVLVNDRPIPSFPLRDGDEITVGPFRFRLELPAPADDEAAVEAACDALRTQAAAVAAQQTALNEEEMRLDHRQGALEAQEEQLARRLDERRRRLLDLQEQTRQERQAFQAARAAAERQQAAARRELGAAREAAAAVSKQARAERQRLVELRKRLRRRWRRQWEAKEADLARREKEAAEREARLGQEAENHRRERAVRDEERLRLNGAVELARRQTSEQWQELALAQQQWEACLNAEHAEREKRARQLDARAAALEEAEHVWEGRERSVRLMAAELHRESLGLEERIRNQREKLDELEAAAARLRAEQGAAPAPAVPLPPAAAIPAPIIVKGRATALERIAGSLADQRAHLLEQWQALLCVQEQWRRERDEAMAGLEAAGRALQEREQRLLARERQLDAATADCRQRQQCLSQMRYSLEGWQARLKARDAAWQAERAALTAEIRGREEALGNQVRRLQEIAKRRELQRGKEAEELAAARAACEDLRRQYVALWEECGRRRAELAREQRDLAARTLAAEQLRLELVGKAAHSARAERRMERLRRRNAVRLAAEERETEVARRGLAAEAGRLDELAARLARQQGELALRREELTRQQTAWEERRAEEDAAEQRRQLEARRLQARRASDEQLIAQLRDEVERTASLLMEQAEAPAAQAA